MSNHNSANTNCDLIMYAGNEGVQCTCDIDPPSEPSVAISTQGASLPAGLAFGPAMPALAAALLDEYKQAALGLVAAKRTLQPAQDRFDRAMSAFTAALIGQ